MKNLRYHREKINDEEKSTSYGNDNDPHVSKFISEFTYKSDHETWAAFKNGNKSAFIYIYNTYFGDLYTYARQFTCDLDLIKDAIQDVFVHVNESKERLSATNNIKFYLLKSLKREIIHALKKKHKSDGQLVGLGSLGFLYDAPLEEILINRQFSEETLKLLHEAVNNLNDKQREIIFYHFFENFTIGQIKVLMKFSSVNAAYNLLNRALIQLRKVVEFNLPV